MPDKGNKRVVVYVATYADLNDAKTDYTAVKHLYSAGIIGTYDAAIISKDTTGKVAIVRTEIPTRIGGWTGLAVGTLVGLFFPPYLLWDLAIGSVAGALIGHFWRGLSRSDMEQIGDTLQKSTATLIVIGRSRLEEALQNAVKHAVKRFEKELNTDVATFNKDLTEAVNQSLVQDAMSEKRTA